LVVADQTKRLTPDSIEAIESADVLLRPVLLELRRQTLRAS
jgi:hypothetical protein